ncbi:MAG: putative anti-sigma factor antagonist [Actinomycetia bacterium]|nr:putative anti-sigma factor antagonist [Actinomycetes bacterium]
MPDIAEPLLVVTVEREGRSAIVRIEGEVEFATAPRLRATLLDLAHQGALPVILDLSEVSFLDSAGISLLIQAKKRLANGGSDLVLRAPQRNVRRVLEISGVTELFSIQPE